MNKTIQHFGIASVAAGCAAGAACAAPVAVPAVVVTTIAAGAGGYAGSQLADAIDDLLCKPSKPSPPASSEQEAPPSEEATATYRNNREPNWVFYEEPSVAYSVLMAHSAAFLCLLPAALKGARDTP